MARTAAAALRLRQLGGMAYAVDFVFRLVFFRAHSLHGEQRVLRTAVAFFTDAVLLAPQIAVDGIALRDFVVAEALGKTHAAAVAEFAQQGEHLPLDVGRRSLGRVAEINLVLDLQPAQLRVQQGQFFVDGHPEISSRQCRGSQASWTRFP